MVMMMMVKAMVIMMNSYVSYSLGATFVYTTAPRSIYEMQVPPTPLIGNKLETENGFEPYGFQPRGPTDSNRGVPLFAKERCTDMVATDHMAHDSF